MKDKPIGIFDSGLGGLTVVNAMSSALPGESIIYVGDTARVPYGEKDANILRSYGQEIIRFLQKKEVKAVVVACGTISSNVMDELWSEFDIPIIDVARPGIEAALITAKKRIGIIATAATIKSGFFQKTIAEKNPKLEIEAISCPLFVPLIEEGWSRHAVTPSIVKAYLQCWLDNPIDTLILGCTHYPLLAESISQVLNKRASQTKNEFTNLEKDDVKLIDMSAATMNELRKYLTNNDLLNEKNSAKREFFVSGDMVKFNDMGSQITGQTIHAQKYIVI